jgi:hypothetical protein
MALIFQITRSPALCSGLNLYGYQITELRVSLSRIPVMETPLYFKIGPIITGLPGPTKIKRPNLAIAVSKMAKSSKMK